MTKPVITMHIANGYASFKRHQDMADGEYELYLAPTNPDALIGAPTAENGDA